MWTIKGPPRKYKEIDKEDYADFSAFTHIQNIKSVGVHVPKSEYQKPQKKYDCRANLNFGKGAESY